MKFTIAIALIGALLVSTTATDDAYEKYHPQLRHALKKDRDSSAMSLPELTQRKLLCTAYH